MPGLVVMAMGAAGLLSACSGDDRPDEWTPMGGAGSVIPDSSCTPGRQKECGFTLHQEGGIKTCYRGVKHCDEDGKWGECTDGEVTQEPDSSSKKSRLFVDPRSLSELQTLSDVTPVDCVDPCDPQCMNFIEGNPDLGPPPVLGGGEGAPFPGVEGDECLHGLCETGAALDASCDPCVNTICNLTANGIPPDSACCTTAWDSQCVDEVYTKCLNTPPPFGLCDFGLLSMSTLTAANRPVSNGTSIGSVGNLTIGTDAFCGASSGSVVTPDKIVTGGDLSIKSQNGGRCGGSTPNTIQIPGGVWVKGSVNNSDHGGGIGYQGDWNVVGGISLNNGHSIIGNVHAQSNPSGVTITGGSPGNPHYPPKPSYKLPVFELPTSLPALPTGCSEANNFPAPASGKSATISGGTYRLPPGDYGSLVVQNGGKLVLEAAGRYTFTSLTIRATGTGQNPTSGGLQLGTTSYAAGEKFEVIVCGALEFQNYVRTINYSGNANSATSMPKLTEPERLLMYAGGAVNFGTDNYLAGVLIVPNGKYTAGDRTKISGAVWAKEFQSGTDTSASPIDKAKCEALLSDADGGGPGTCPIIPTGSGGLPPSEVEPCQTGLSCQINQRCTDVSTSDTCAHSKCVPGDKLGPSCDPCVARICGANPSCCATAWTQACVDLVATQCDASCGEVTGCAHDVCTTGSRLVQGCEAGATGSGNCTQSVCSNAAYAYCCDPSSGAGWDAACVTRAKAVCTGTPSGGGGTSACNYAIVGSAVTLGSGNHGNPTNPVELRTTNSVITKNLTGVTCGGGSTPVDSSRSWDAGNRGNVTVNNGSTLTLNAGTHNINSLTLNNQARVQFNGNVTLNICGNLNVNQQTYLAMASAPSNVAINVKGNVTFGQDARVTGLNLGVDLLRLKLYAAGNFTMGPNATTSGVFLGGGPTSSITMQGGKAGEAIHLGVLWANGPVTMVDAWSAWPRVLNSIPVASCTVGTAGLIAAAPAACPVTTPEAVFSGDDDGLCVSNDDGWTQDSCSGFDLALDYVCGSTVSVCNHGSDALPAGDVTIGYYSIQDSPHFAIESPGAATGTCTQTLPAIPPGGCRDLTCNIPTGEDYTVMVDPSDLLNECSRLDNWSWRDDDFVCASGSPLTSVEYEYKAVCPDKATSPRWKNLTWSSTVPNGSSLTFSAKVADSLEELDDADYMTLSPQAAPQPTDTTDCVLPDCTVGLTDQLGLSTNQGTFLSLRVEEDHSGGSPTMDDWTVSYTCQYDQ